jgi:hypothetical protein
MQITQQKNVSYRDEFIRFLTTDYEETIHYLHTRTVIYDDDGVLVKFESFLSHQFTDYSNTWTTKISRVPVIGGINIPGYSPNLLGLIILGTLSVVMLNFWKKSSKIR